MTTLTYCNANADFLTRVAPFYIKVSDADNPDNDEIMKVTAHDPATYTLTVTRGQQGTSACAHANYAAISTYSGARDLVRFGIFQIPSYSRCRTPPAKMVDRSTISAKKMPAANISPLPLISTQSSSTRSTPCRPNGIYASGQGAGLCLELPEAQSRHRHCRQLYRYRHQRLESR